MMCLIAFWKGSNHDELRATGIHAHARRVEYRDFNGMIIVTAFIDHPDSRAAIDALHAKLVVLPGPNGKLKKRHADPLAKALPQVKEGDTISGLMASLYSELGDETFNPDAL